jgi:hypothetical protein
MNRHFFLDYLRIHERASRPSDGIHSCVGMNYYLYSTTRTSKVANEMLYSYGILVFAVVWIQYLVIKIELYC